ncbi:60s ribosomal protein l14 [Lichtheimia corymbifera JMRC:FSU:9682]|uniref:60s ribosomal protein l14 n=1 Tax=Lichtheimia corymbifera JMRC:FSU:9682 TaxID=1263082 RepID=A0A068RQW4_9FUNG|nr:60s ribosomal protein l14 [Lichtheimia corymbifera JMRC:FSU:9682]
MQGSFKRQVEVGRVVLINHGADSNKIAVIVDIVDHKRALVDGPTTGVARQALAFDRMILTNIVVKGLPRNAGQTTLKKYLEKEEVMAKWSKSAWAQKLATRQTRTSLSDFDRFKVAKLKNQRRFAVNSAVAQAVKTA